MKKDQFDQIMKPFSNQLFTSRRSHFRIFRWRMWLVVWFVAVLLPCTSEASAFEKRDKWRQIGNESIGIVILYDNSRMGNVIDLGEIQSQAGLKALGLPVKLDSFNRFQSSNDAEKASDNTSDNTRTQRNNDGIHGSSSFWVVICIPLGIGIGLVIVEIICHLFIVPVGWLEPVMDWLFPSSKW